MLKLNQFRKFYILVNTPAIISFIILIIAMNLKTNIFVFHYDPHSNENIYSDNIKLLFDFCVGLLFYFKGYIILSLNILKRLKNVTITGFTYFITIAFLAIQMVFMLSTFNSAIIPNELSWSWYLIMFLPLSVIPLILLKFKPNDCNF